MTVHGLDGVAEKSIVKMPFFLSCTVPLSLDPRSEPTIPGSFQSAQSVEPRVEPIGNLKPEPKLPLLSSTCLCPTRISLFSCAIVNTTASEPSPASGDGNNGGPFTLATGGSDDRESLAHADPSLDTSATGTSILEGTFVTSRPKLAFGFSKNTSPDTI